MDEPEEPAEEPMEEPAEEPMEEPTEEPMEEPTEEPMEETRLHDGRRVDGSRQDRADRPG